VTAVRKVKVTDEAIEAAARRHRSALDQLDEAFARAGQTARELLDQLSEADDVGSD